jgi:hypothetical protein
VSTQPGKLVGVIGAEVNPPQTVNALSPEWLTAHLCRIGAVRSARVVSIETASVGEFGMSGDLRRLLLSYDHAETGAPTSLVAKFATGNVELRAVLHSMGIYEREARFYVDLAARCPVRVPRCYFASVDIRSGASLLLLEDLSAIESLGWKPVLTIAEAEVLVRAIAALHTAWWGNDRLQGLSWLTLRGLTAKDQVQPVFERYWESFLGKLSVPITEEVLGVGRCGRHYLAAASAYLHGKAPVTLVHNDVQGANILFDRIERSAVLLDWQQTTIGRGAVDVAYFLCGCLSPENRRLAWDRLVRMYYELLLEGGVADYSLERCQIDCRVAVLPAATRVATAIGAHPDLHADPEAFWNDIFPRYAAALNELNVADVCAQLFD